MGLSTCQTTTRGKDLGQRRLIALEGAADDLVDDSVSLALPPPLLYPCASGPTGNREIRVGHHASASRRPGGSTSSSGASRKDNRPKATHPAETDGVLVLVGRPGRGADRPAWLP